MNGKKAKRLRRQAEQEAAAAPGFLGRKNRTVYRKDKDGKKEFIKVLGTIINRPGSVRAKYQALKKVK